MDEEAIIEVHCSCDRERIECLHVFFRSSKASYRQYHPRNDELDLAKLGIYRTSLDLGLVEDIDWIRIKFNTSLDRFTFENNFMPTKHAHSLKSKDYKHLIYPVSSDLVGPSQLPVRDERVTFHTPVTKQIGTEKGKNSIINPVEQQPPHGDGISGATTPYEQINQLAKIQWGAFDNQPFMKASSLSNEDITFSRRSSPLLETEQTVEKEENPNDMRKSERKIEYKLMKGFRIDVLLASSEIDQGRFDLAGLMKLPKVNRTMGKDIKTPGFRESTETLEI